MNPILNHPQQPPAFLPVVLAVLFAIVPTAMAQHTIDFSKSTNLKAVYDAGLRPWRINPELARSLLVTDQQIRIIAPGTSPFTLDVEIGDFPVCAGNDLSSADFISQPMSLAEAAAKVREVSKALNIDLTRGAGMGGFEEKAGQLTTLGNQTPAPQYWNGRSEINGVRYSVTLYPLFGMNETRGKVYVTLDFHQPGKPMKFLMEPIKQPPGYEHLSMERPETFPAKPFPDPAFGFDKMKRRIDEMKASAASPTRPTLPPAAAPQGPPPVVHTAVPWPWIIGALLVLGVIGGALFRMYMRASR